MEAKRNFTKSFFYLGITRETKWIIFSSYRRIISYFKRNVNPCPNFFARFLIIERQSRKAASPHS